MKINQEKFNQLSQLDRIEFRQKEDRIKEKTNKSDFLSLINFTMLLMGFCSLIYVGLFNISVEIATKFIVGLILPFRLLVIFLIICFFIDIFRINKRNKELTNLEKEFFEVKTKSKKQK